MNPPDGLHARCVHLQVEVDLGSPTHTLWIYVAKT